MLVASLFLISNALLSSRHINPPQDDVVRRGLLRPDVNEEIEIFSPPTVKYKSDATTDEPICSRPGCTNKVQSRGLCKRHYAYKNYLLQSQLRRSCKVDGCMKRTKAGGYCQAHAYAPSAYDKLRSGTSCKVEGFEKQAQSQLGGYCKKHARVHDPDLYNEYIAEILYVLTKDVRY